MGSTRMFALRPLICLLPGGGLGSGCDTTSHKLWFRLVVRLVWCVVVVVVVVLGMQTADMLGCLNKELLARALHGGGGLEIFQPYRLCLEHGELLLHITEQHLCSRELPRPLVEPLGGLIDVCLELLF